MNKGKVRIYDLSKELSLENKDILAICERLDIAAKSHSSTITEEQADNIRAAAPKQPAGKAAVVKTPPKRPTHKGGGSSGGGRNGSHSKMPKRPVRKQQILEIRRQPLVSPSKPAEVSRPAEPSSVPASSGADRADSLMGPPSRPVRPGSKPAPPVRPSRPVARTDKPSNAEPETAVASLAGPPARPQSPRPRPGKPQGEAIMSKPVKPRPAAVDGGAAAPNLKPKPVIELRRPAANRADAQAEAAGDAGEEVLDVAIVPGEERGRPDLRRPTPLRAPKRKQRSDDDDDQEMRPKANKGAAKAKRRAQLIHEADELEDVDGSSAESLAAAQISLSLMRPPKPKSRQTQAKPTTVKSRTISRGGSSRSQRRERREEPKVEKPEMIVLTGGLTVHELAARIAVPETEIIKSLFFKGIAANINQTLDVPTAKMVAEEFEILVETAEAESEAKKVTEMLDEADLENLQHRPPVVTIMGHVDHGKTSLLDAIRKAKVAQGEAGGITQHIGAYHVDVEHEGEDRQVVFLDTPGHEAFTAMRARGARVTDIAVLVVAADDGVRPQTIEAISHAKAAKVPIVTAINKIDKETANPDRVKQELMEHGLVPEEWGGDNIMVPVSAISGENLDLLLEMLLLQAEVEDLHANPDRLARGTVIEAHLDKARGPVATLLIQNGTLRVGDSIVAGAVFGKVRAMIDDRGDRVEVASPSFAVEVLGLNDVPQAGEEFEVYADEKQARSAADDKASEQRLSRLQQAMASRRVTLNSLSAQAQEGDLKELNLILKADVQGSVEAILASLQQLPQNEVQIRVLMAAPGEISETDVDLAAASSAVIVGFNTTLAPGARQSSDRLGVDIRDYDIIYKLLEDIEGAMEGLLEPELVEEDLGEVEVRAVFPVRRGTVAGCYVLSGKVTRNCQIRVMRSGEQVYQGNLDSLKRMKDDVKEVNSGFECGIGVNNFNAWQEGDRIMAFKMVSKRRSLTGGS
ncbi:MAG: translation initiation factor IF-2 [Cyanobacteria bacterium P01_D01_bin.44]